MPSFPAQRAANMPNFEAGPDRGFSYQRRSSTADKSGLPDSGCIADRSHLRDVDVFGREVF